MTRRHQRPAHGKLPARPCNRLGIPGPPSRPRGDPVPFRPDRPCGGWRGNWESIWRRFKGSGQHGRITVEDVKAALATQARSAEPAPAVAPAAPMAMGAGRAGGSAGRGRPGQLGAGAPRADVADPPHHRGPHGQVGRNDSPRDELRRCRHHRPGPAAKERAAGLPGREPQAHHDAHPDEGRCARRCGVTPC